MHCRHRPATEAPTYDKATGELLAGIPVGSNASGSPMTCQIDGRQCIVFPVGRSRSVPEEFVAVGVPAAP
ncbi:MAG: hypothetical protein U1E60_05900 [Reyranellaceae bacterium]